jgi:hypothetical protein
MPDEYSCALLGASISRCSPVRTPSGESILNNDQGVPPASCLGEVHTTLANVP